MNNSLESVIDSSKSLLILLPMNPDMDTVAAGLSLFLGINRPDIVIACPSPMLVEFNRLVGIDKITTELGSKNLSVTFADYQAENVDKVSYDIIDGQFKLTIAPKPGLTPPQKDQIILTYSGISADTIITIGGDNENQFPNLKSKDLGEARLAHIGTRSVNLGRDTISFDTPSSSVSEIIGSYLIQNPKGMGADIATNLLMGIEDATAGLMNQEVTAETFNLIASLMKSGGKRYIAALEPQREQFPQGSIPGIPFNPSQNFPQQNPSGRIPKSWLEPKIYKGTNPS